MPKTKKKNPEKFKTTPASRPAFKGSASATSAAATGLGVSDGGIRLRSRVVLRTTILKEKRSGFRDKKKFAYPSTEGERPAAPRKPMGTDVTNDLIARGPKDPFRSSKARSAEPLQKGKKTQLKKQGISRNHILADSRIRLILLKMARKVGGAKIRAREKAALQKFLESLSGAKTGRAQVRKFIKFSAKSDLTALDDLSHEIAAGRENLRFGDADINTVIDLPLSISSTEV